MYTAQGVLAKDQQIAHYMPLVRRIAYLLMARLPASVDVDDLIQNGLIGLLDALERYEEGLGAQFETYAVQRIRGAMLDGLRENDWMPRSVRREMRRVEEAIRTLEHERGRAPSEKELADALGLSLADYQKLLLDARGHQLVYIEDITDGSGDDYLERHVSETSRDPLGLLEEESTRAALAAAIEALPEREKLMMALYYEQDLNLREIGEVMGVTESRVCQLHSQAVARLRTVLTGTGKAAGSGRRGRSAARAGA
ncbi:MAG: RNA polymerase sigma factor FliA [Sulfuritalea sp.]|nr:RNA polymerase sigma factor FliA [Sulfuritalea sp.]